MPGKPNRINSLCVTADMPEALIVLDQCIEMLFLPSPVRPENHRGWSRCRRVSQTQQPTRAFVRISAYCQETGNASRFGPFSRDILRLQNQITRPDAACT